MVHFYEKLCTIARKRKEKILLHLVLIKDTLAGYNNNCKAATQTVKQTLHNKPKGSKHRSNIRRIYPLPPFFAPYGAVFDNFYHRFLL